jgi:CTP:phosphocholine cytidylyltransferase-like protein
MARSESYNNITSHVSASHTNKDVYFVNPNQNYLVTFDDKQRDKTDKSQMKNKLQVSKKKSNETLPQHDSKKNLFILSIGSNNEFIKRIQMSNTNTTINE